MAWWDRAVDLQQKVRFSEDRQDMDYTDDDERRSIVHTRHDIVLIASLLDSLNGQIATIKIVLIGIAGMIAYSVFWR